MLHCARLTHARSPCWCACRNALCLLSAAAAMSKHTMVSMQNDDSTIYAEGAQEGPLSRAAVLVCCAAW